MKQKQLIPNDTIYSKLYPFPQALSKKTATIILGIIVLFFIAVMFITILGQ